MTSKELRVDRIITKYLLDPYTAESLLIKHVRVGLCKLNMDELDSLRIVLLTKIG